MKYEYLKGREKDFEGAPEWARQVIKSETDNVGFVVELDYMCKYQGVSGCVFNVSNPGLWKVVAERQPITEPSWDGIGLPPVGCECEYVGNDTSWGIVKVIGHDGDKVVFKPSGDDYYAIAPSNKCIFLPIRSEADKKRDAAIKALDNWLPEYTTDIPSLDGAIAMYDAIAAGKILGVKLED